MQGSEAASLRSAFTSSQSSLRSLCPLVRL